MCDLEKNSNIKHVVYVTDKYNYREKAFKAMIEGNVKYLKKLIDKGIVTRVSISDEN